MQFNPQEEYEGMKLLNKWFGERLEKGESIEIKKTKRGITVYEVKKRIIAQEHNAEKEGSR